MSNFLKFRKRLKAQKEKAKQAGILIGEQNYVSLLTKQSKSHADEIIELNKNYRKELNLFEKEYQIKMTIVEKKIRRLDGLINEWENKTTKVRKLLKSTHEINSQVKQKLYQNRKELAGVEDDEKTLEAIETNLDISLRKTTLSNGFKEN